MERHRSAWVLLAIVCFLASLLVPGIASAHSAAGAENRVWAFDLQDQTCAGVERSPTLELHRGREPTYDDLASDSLLAARGAGALGGRAITVADGYVTAEGSAFKFSQYYYDKLWATGRGAPRACRSSTERT